MEVLTLQEAKPSQVFICPLGLVLDHPPKYIHREGLPWAVKSYRHPSSIGVTVSLVTPCLASEKETVSVECIDNFTSCYAPEISPGDRHRLDGDRYPWLG